MVQSSDQGHGRASNDGHARTAVPATRGSLPAATGRPRRVHVCMNLSPWCSITHSCAPWLLLIDSVLVESGHGWPELAQPGGHGTCLQLAPHCSSGDGLQLLRGCAPKSLPHPQPLQLMQSTRSKLLLRGLDWIALIIWAPLLVFQFGLDAERRRSISGAGWEFLRLVACANTDNLVNVSCNRRLG
ncbi:hypothetical protein GQ55_4G016400 [Panicum hallii var. hallii]|uniref:Uncharacterized protein n=1 Tax=Panicum hallii var. hallii TaxID=1504633 RepID=A0A2T7DU87_9POAL|nr:hypothetical protein GQ55_4G016400 [Panicum hallii var. hallii]